MRKAVATTLALAVTWAAASLARANDIAVFNTGVDANGNVLSPGHNDPHWSIVQVPAGSGYTAGAAAKVAFAHPVYVQNDAVGSAGSSWISAGSDTADDYPPGTYVYRTTFDLSGLKPSTAHLSGVFAVDDTVTSVVLNGTTLPISGGMFVLMNATFDVTTGFVDGVNTLDFVVSNLGFNPTGFRAVIHGTADLAVVPDTTAPVISGCSDRTFEYAGQPVALDAAALGITALDDRDGAVAVTLSPNSVGLGTTLVTASAHDAAGNTATVQFDVTVADTTAPVFTSISVTPDTIDQRNHKMVPVTVTAQVADAGDPAPVVQIVSITSNEGNDPSDTQVTGAMTAQVRAERNGKGSGRTYTITVTATDASGNVGTATVTVFVPHDDGKHGR
jgi:hypothetical protein